MDEKKKKLKKIATWMIAVFATIFAVTVAVLWLPLYPQSTSAMNSLGMVFAAGWPVLLADLVLCLAAYFGYKLYLDKKK
jgi:hypothetical protein